ncbi:PREDICTED: uncharacterized protein LOC101315001 [Fragaria vesca subsp. vesca]
MESGGNQIDGDQLLAQGLVEIEEEQIHIVMLCTSSNQRHACRRNHPPPYQSGGSSTLDHIVSDLPPLLQVLLVSRFPRQTKTPRPTAAAQRYNLVTPESVLPDISSKHPQTQILDSSIAPKQNSSTVVFKHRCRNNQSPKSLSWQSRRSLSKLRASTPS